MRALTHKDISEFHRLVRTYYRTNGRRTLPWRSTHDPYAILVSEIMLQQTQVERVIPKYKDFLKRFPTVQELSRATLGDVLRAWSGLGYNRRARLLHRASQDIVQVYKGQFPDLYEVLRTLPGIGPYTAGALMAFAYSKGIPMIETNIRSVYLHHFFKAQSNISDRDIMVRVKETLPRTHVREWYWALMDYGVYIKRTYGNPNTKSAHHVRQGTFKGSVREVRGAIIRTLTEDSCSTKKLLSILANYERTIVLEQLVHLKREGMIVYAKRAWQLP